MNPTFSPLYQQIKLLLTQSLKKGEWKPGEVMPSETDLALRYGVSQGTMRKAIDALASDNLVVRKQGRGTFVATHNEAKSQYRFLRLCDDAGSLEKPESTYLSLEQVQADDVLALRLQVNVGDLIYVIKRVLMFASKPLVFDEIYLPGSRYSSLTLARLQQWKASLYGLLETDFDVQMLRATENIKAVNAFSEQARVLQVQEGAALLYVERLSMTYSDTPVELRRGWYLTHGFSYRNELY
jgi:GntR family transcriptional regulator